MPTNNLTNYHETTTFLPHPITTMHSQKTKKEIILETAAFYGEDPSRRAVIKEDGRAKCRYLTEDGRKCAVGKCLIEGKKMLYVGVVDPQEAMSAELVDGQVHDIANLEDVLMPEYRGHDTYFWSGLQEFHDSDFHFTDTGLSELGERYLKILLEQYANN